MLHSNLQTALLSIHHRLLYLESLVHLNATSPSLPQVPFFNNSTVKQFSRFMQREWRSYLNPTLDNARWVWDNPLPTSLFDRTNKLYQRHIEVLKPQYGSLLIEEIHRNVILFLRSVQSRNKKEARLYFRQIMQYVSPPVPSFSSG